jgi:hypothetical protein
MQVQFAIKIKEFAKSLIVTASVANAQECKFISYLMEFAI